MSSYPFQLTRSAYVVVLKKTDPSPLAPESDEEKIAEKKKPEAPSDKPAEASRKLIRLRRAPAQRQAGR